LALGLAVYLAVSFAAAWFVCHPLTRPVRKPKKLEPYRPSDVTFRSSDGTLLSGWWFQASDAVGSVVLCHGAFENRMALIDCVPHLLEGHLNVLLFDFRARGRSEGRLNTLGKRETEDALAAVNWIRQASEAGDLPIGGMGFSMGAAALLLAAAREEQIAAMVADSPYASLDRAVGRHLKTFFGPFKGTLGWAFKSFGRRLLGFEPATVRPLDAIGQLAPRPVLLIHGEGDFMTDPQDSRDLQQAGGENVTLWLVPQARHTKARKKDPEEYWERVMGFWREVLSGKKGSEGQ